MEFKYKGRPIEFVKTEGLNCGGCVAGDEPVTVDTCNHCDGGIFKYTDDTESNYQEGLLPQEIAPNIPVKHLMCTCGAGLLLRGGSRTTFHEVCPICGVNQKYIQDTEIAPESPVISNDPNGDAWTFPDFEEKPVELKTSPVTLDSLSIKLDNIIEQLQIPNNRERSERVNT